MAGVHAEWDACVFRHEQLREGHTRGQALPIRTPNALPRWAKGKGKSQVRQRYGSG